MTQKRILVGSRVFFSGMDGFRSKDTDYVVLVDEPKQFNWRRETSMRGICTFEYKREPAADMIARTVKHGDALLLGKFLVPEVLTEIDADIEDIKPLAALLPKLDDKHKYEVLIFEAYMNNKAFTLTEEQRIEAYHQYLLARTEQKEANHNQLR